MNFTSGKIIVSVDIGIWSSGCFWLAIGLVLFRNPADSLTVCHSDPQTSVVMLSWGGWTNAGPDVVYVWDGAVEQKEGRWLSCIIPRFSFLNAGHSLTEISSRRLSLANYCLAYPSLALDRAAVFTEKTGFTSTHLCCVWKVGPVLSDTWKYGITDLCVSVCSCGSVVEHCVSSAKVVGSIPREHAYWQINV